MKQSEKKEYFNRLKFVQAISLMETSPCDALNNLKEYISEYPEDYSAYPYYISCLITFGYTDEAIKIMDDVKMMAYGNNRFIYDNDKYRYFFHHMIYIKVRLFGYLEKYDELYKLYLDNKTYIDNSRLNLQYINYYCRKKMGLSNNGRKNMVSGYMYGQMDEYSEDKFLEHIKKHMADYNIGLDKPNDTIFSPDFPIEKIVSEIKKYIPSDKGLFLGFIEDDYIFKYDSCGRDKNRVVDYFKVICFHNTSDFITMCPVYGYERYPYIDLNYMKKEEDIKIKRRSQIDRFNSRYNK